MFDKKSIHKIIPRRSIMFRTPDQKNINPTIGKIVVMRHAETNYNYPRKRMQGLSPSDKIHISERGRQEAASKLASITLPDILIMSPLLRCKQTVEAWAGNDLTKIKSQINFMDGLKEVDVGELEDFYVDELEKHEKYGSIWQSWKMDPLHFPGFPGGEKLHTFQSRVLNAFSDICKKHTLNPTLNICVVTHGGPMRVLKCFLANKDLSHLWDGQDITNLERLELTSEQILRLKNQGENKEMLSMQGSEAKKSLAMDTRKSELEFVRPLEQKRALVCDEPGLKDEVAFDRTYRQELENKKSPRQENSFFDNSSPTISAQKNEILSPDPKPRK